MNIVLSSWVPRCICNGADYAVGSVGVGSPCSILGIFDSVYWLVDCVPGRSYCGIGGSLPRNMAVPVSARQLLGILQNCFTRTHVPRAITVATARAWKTLYLAVAMVVMDSCAGNNLSHLSLLLS